MNTPFSRRVAAALLISGLTAPLAAQATGGAARTRDTAIVRAFGNGKNDTVLVLFRALDRAEYGSQGWTAITHQLDSLLAMRAMKDARYFVRAASGREFNGVVGPSGSMPKGWIGILPQGPSTTYIDTAGLRITYFSYPLILSVDPESPAERAGIAPGDLLIAYNGLDVIGREFNLTRMLIPERKLAVTVRHDGEKKDYSLDIAKAPEGVFSRRVAFDGMPLPPMPPGAIRMEIREEQPTRTSGSGTVIAVPRAPSAGGGGARVGAMFGGRGGPLMSGAFIVITPHGAFGANLSAVGKELATVLRLEKGMLVTEAPAESPAFKSGLRAGDVIVSAAGQPVVTLNDLQDVVISRMGERSIALQIVRDHKPNKLTVTW